MRSIFLSISVSLSILFPSCVSDKPQTGILSGTVKVLADPSFAPVVLAEEERFEATYEQADLQINLIPEIEAVQLFLKDSVNFIFSSRRLTENEKQLLDPEVPLTEIHFATDGIAFITDLTGFKELDVELLYNMLSGKVKSWEEAGKGAGEITVVADESNSANLLFLKNYFQLNPSEIEIVAAGSNEKVIDYVSSHPGAIGVIGSAYISDEEDPEMKERRKRIQVVQVKTPEGVFTPFQSSLSSENNPLRRNIYVIRRNRSKDVGVGFSAFLVGEKGQRIVLKSGLLPASMPGREVKINKE